MTCIFSGVEARLQDRTSTGNLSEEANALAHVLDRCKEDLSGSEGSRRGCTLTILS